jgi:hypothetical protein
MTRFSLQEFSEFERQLFQQRNIEVIAIGSEDISNNAANIIREMAA